jgi:hypothetical protein
MAKELKPGERVTVNRELHIKRTSEAYQHGLKRVKPGDLGEVVGPAEGRALTVKFKGIDTVVSKLRLARPEQPPATKAKPAARKPVQAKAAKASATPGTAPQASAHVKASPAQDFEDGALHLLNTVANKLLLKGSTRIEQDGVVEVSLHDLPANVRERLQALIDAKLAFNPKDLGKQ